MDRIDLLLTGIGCLVTPVGNAPHRGQAMSELREIPQAAIAMRDGLIALAGPESDVLNGLGGAAVAETLDAGGCLAAPGLVDPHTHLVHAGSREHELALKRAGMPYLDILAQGGGILSTVRATRGASARELYEKAYRSLDIMLLQGVTTVEAKSGYGLSLETERKQLRAAKLLNDAHPLDIASTFMGAHAVPAEYKGRTDEYADLVCEMLPRIAEEGLAEFCDVFCEHGVFTVEQSRRILLAGRRCGLHSKIHADEIESLGGAELAGELGAVSADHLLAASDEGLRMLAANGVIPVLLPGTSFNLGLNRHARARDMIDKFNLPVSLATDYNPGSCPTESIQLVIMLASLNLKMTPEEILTACTINAACAIGRGHRIGTIEAGKQADIVLFDAPNLAYLPYHFGVNHAYGVIKNGQAAVWNRQIVKPRSNSGEGTP
ncbi:imidazolonepropionase [Paenibacillus rhizovicinus]|uniref:Imidazolonepropionase n=1 Tax=Paenibacillus rhizovicinus TaxID=2704463 RepID=A0A6C0P8J5_9BACL|nr:imidazolonepropionase [Paenibacillus rhizovicinus]